MARAYRAEQEFSRKIRLARFHETAEWMHWTSLRLVRRVIRASHLNFTEERFHPSRPNHIYLLAGEIRNGGYENHERFLHYLGHDVSGDTVAAADEVVRVAFTPRSHRRREWWRESSHEASDWL